MRNMSSCPTSVFSPFLILFPNTPASLNFPLLFHVFLLCASGFTESMRDSTHLEVRPRRLLAPSWEKECSSMDRTMKQTRQHFTSLDLVFHLSVGKVLLQILVHLLSTPQGQVNDECYARYSLSIPRNSILNCVCKKGTPYIFFHLEIFQGSL